MRNIIKTKEQNKSIVLGAGHDDAVSAAAAAAAAASTTAVKMAVLIYCGEKVAEAAAFNLIF